MPKRPTRNTLDPRRLPDLLTVKEFAAISRHGEAAIRAQLRAGTLDGCKQGALWLVRRHEAEKLLGIEPSEGMNI